MGKKILQAGVGFSIGLAFAVYITCAAIADPGGWEAWRVALCVTPGSVLFGTIAGWTYPG